MTQSSDYTPCVGISAPGNKHVMVILHFKDEDEANIFIARFQKFKKTPYRNVAILIAMSQQLYELKPMNDAKPNAMNNLYMDWFGEN